MTIEVWRPRTAEIAWLSRLHLAPHDVIECGRDLGSERVVQQHRGRRFEPVQLRRFHSIRYAACVQVRRPCEVRASPPPSSDHWDAWAPSRPQR